jgi:hypothetical protein
MLKAQRATPLLIPRLVRRAGTRLNRRLARELAAAATLLAGAAFGCLSACSSEPSASDAPAPEWTREATRIVDNGYIVYVESEDDSKRDRARLKAEGLALQDLANECTFVPKGTRIEDRFEQKNGHVYQAFIKVGLEMQACEEAKKATTPEAIRKLADAPMTEEIKRFQELDGKPELESVAQGEGSDVTLPAGSPGSGPGPGSGGGTIVVADARGYYIAREQVAVVKQTVILAPPSAYPPDSMQTRNPVPALAAPMQATSVYEGSHPEVRQAPQPWTQYRRQIMREQRSAAPQARGGAGAAGGGGGRAMPAPARPASHPGGAPAPGPKRRRRGR